VVLFSYLAVHGVARQRIGFDTYVVDYDVAKLNPHDKRTGKDVRKKENMESVCVFPLVTLQYILLSVWAIKNVFT
jgi:hypothetical protein